MYFLSVLKIVSSSAMEQILKLSGLVGYYLPSVCLIFHENILIINNIIWAKKYQF